MSGETLVAGPYTGEFGWELCAWVPRVRRLAAAYARTIVLAPAASAAAYEFADEFVPVQVVPGTANEIEGELAEPPPPPIEGARFLPSSEISRLERLAFRSPALWRCLDASKRWRRYGRPRSGAPDVVLSLRPGKLYRGTVNLRREYPPHLAEDVAQRLRRSGLDLACIGGHENGLVDGAVDLRGAPLTVQMDALAGARVALGPSSGPLHLAQLCGCAVVTWYDAVSPRERADSRMRYAGLWNPLRTPLVYLDAGVPSPAAVVAAVEQAWVEHQQHRTS